MAELTRCQLRALSLAADGLRVGEIAELMNISVRTAEHHLKTARKAMDSKTTAGAVASAIRQGLITSIVAIIIGMQAAGFDGDYMRGRGDNGRFARRVELRIRETQ